MSTLFRISWLSLLSVALAFTCTACNGSNDGFGAGDDDDVADDDVVAPYVCEFPGTWDLISIACAETDVSAEWFAIFESSVMAITAGDGVCDVEMTLSSSTCVEVETLEFIAEDDEIDGDSLGITKCTPDACTFIQGDDPCEIGDRAGAMNADEFILDGTLFTVTGKDPDGMCGEDSMVQVWQRQ